MHTWPTCVLCMFSEGFDSTLQGLDTTHTTVVNSRRLVLCLCSSSKAGRNGEGNAKFHTSTVLLSREARSGSRKGSCRKASCPFVAATMSRLRAARSMGPPCERASLLGVVNSCSDVRLQYTNSRRVDSSLNEEGGAGKARPQVVQCDSDSMSEAGKLVEP